MRFETDHVGVRNLAGPYFVTAGWTGGEPTGSTNTVWSGTSLMARSGPPNPVAAPPFIDAPSRLQWSSRPARAFQMRDCLVSASRRLLASWLPWLLRSRPAGSTGGAVESPSSQVMLNLTPSP